MSILDKIPERDKEESNVDFALGDCAFKEEYPNLWEFIARQRYKGDPRATGKFVVFTDGCKASVCLIDRCSNQVAFFTADSLDEALRGVDGALGSGGLDWRKDKKAGYRR